MDFVIGGLAAMGASVFSNPFDVVKTRMQLQGELRARGKHAVYYRNTFHAAYTIGKHEGIRGLQKGLGTALIMHSVRNSIRLGVYQTLTTQGLTCDSHGKTVLYKSALVATFSGALGAFFGSPLFLIKTQLQSHADTSIAVGYQHKHVGLTGAFRTIYGQFGIRGLWRGANGIMLRAAAGSPAQLTSFAMCKDLFSSYGIFQQSAMLGTFASSLIAGFIQTVFMTPFDLISTRVYNQATNAQGKGVLYSGIIDCAVKTYKVEGLIGLYKGFGPNYMRLAPHSIFMLVFWDLLKDGHRKYLEDKKK